jgi:hypothetical protein
VGSRTLSFLDTTLRIESNEEDTLSWLDDILVPWFETSAETRELCAIVRRSRDTEASAADEPVELRELPVFLFDSRVVRLPAWRQGSRLVLEDPKEGCRYVLDGLQVRVEVLYGPGRIGFMRVIREIAVEHERRHGRSVELHAAGLELGGKGIALAGPKGSGKTTLLLHALASHAAGLIANDRVVIDTQPGHPRLTGVPSLIRIRPWTAAAFPALASIPAGTGAAEDLADEKMRSVANSRGQTATEPDLRLSGSRLARTFNAPRRISAPLDAVIFPELVAGDRPSRLSRLGPREALERLRASVYGGRLDEDVPTVFTEAVLGACPHARAGDAVRRAKADLITRIAATVPCFHLTAGSDMDPVSDLLRSAVRR